MQKILEQKHYHSEFGAKTDPGVYEGEPDADVPVHSLDLSLDNAIAELNLEDDLNQDDEGTYLLVSGSWNFTMRLQYS